MKPTIRGFGGCPLEGFLVVGMTGVVQAFVFGGTKGKITNTEILGGIRLAYSFVDLAWTRGLSKFIVKLKYFTKFTFATLGGEILAIACTGIPLDPIVYCKLSIKKDEGVEFSCLLDEYRLYSETLTGLFPQQSSGNYKNIPSNDKFATFLSEITGTDIRICGVNFASREDPQGIFLLINGIGNATLQYWELLELERPIHSLFSTSSATTRFLQWQCVSAFNCNSRVTSICSSCNIWINGFDTGSSAQHHLVIATASGELLSLHRDSMKQAYINRSIGLKHNNLL